MYASGCKIGIPLEAFHSFGLKVKAEAILLPRSEGEIPLLASEARYFLGEGTNVLPLGDLPPVLVTRYLRGIELVRSTPYEVEVEVAAGENWDNFVRYCLNAGWYGVENLAAIPGSVGGAAVQNIGAYGVEVAPFIVRVYGWDKGERVWRYWDQAACDYGYRQSRFQQAPWQDRFLITRVRFRLSRRFVPVLTYPDLARIFENQVVNDPWAVYKAIRAIRHRKLPTKGSAGSFFKNPILSEAEVEALRREAPEVPIYLGQGGAYKVPAAWLIDRAGLKGYRIGGAVVHSHQPLVLVNEAEATPSDMAALAQYVQEVVAQRWGIHLEPEVRYLAPT